MIKLGEFHAMCSDLEERMSRRQIPPQMRRQNIKDMIQMVDDVLEVINGDGMDANELAKAALRSETFLKAVALKMGG